VVEGEAGIGKTTLLAAAEELADGFTCLWARGVESEAALGHAALLELLGPVRDRLADLPGAQAQALAAALGWGPAGAPGDRYLVAAATLSLLAAAAERAPVLVLHRTGDRMADVRASRYLAERIPGARFVELPGDDNFVYFGDQDSVVALTQEFLTGATPVEEPDRILATVLFTDIVDSTRLAADLGDRRWHRLLVDHQETVRQQLARFRGREVKTTGDGFLATFDGPARAIRAADAIRGRLRDLGLEVRVGLHTGEVELLGDDIGGIAVHIAARVMAAAGAGEVVCSRTVKDLVAGAGFAFADRGARSLKGVPDTWQLYAVELAGR
jgi:class 3 adenylate cyclase